MGASLQLAAMKTRIRCLLAALIATHVAPMRGPALSPSVALAPRRRKVKPYVLGCAAAGALSTCVSHTLTLPLDVLKTRIQCRDEPAAIGTVLRGLLNEAGWGGLYSGILPRLLSAVPRSVCTVLVYERALLWCRKDG